MSEEQKSISFEEFYRIQRNNIIIAYDGAKETALRSFDAMAQKVLELAKELEQKKPENLNIK